MSSRVDRGKVARGGASQRKTPSLGGAWIASQDLAVGSVLDFGCGYGLDADTFGWDKYDPYYFPTTIDIKEAVGQYDTVVCTYVISAVSESVAESIVEEILTILKKPEGIAYFIVPRNLPKEGKLSGYSRRPQSNVVMRGVGVTSVHLEEKEFEIYAVEASLATPEGIKLSGFYQPKK